MPTSNVTTCANWASRIGVCIHGNASSSYAPSYTTQQNVYNALQHSGITLIRDLLPTTWQSGLYAKLSPLGIRFIAEAGSSPGLSPTQFVNSVQSWLVSNPNTVVAIEGPNEVNNFYVSYSSGGTTYSQPWQSAAYYQRDLYNAVKGSSSSAIKNLPVFSCCTGGGADTSLNGQFGSGTTMAPYCDYGNAHAYPQTAWGFAPWFYWQGNVGFVTQSTPGKPLVVTETGYCTPPGTGPDPLCDTYSQGMYIGCMLFDFLRYPLQYMVLYELMNERSGSTNTQDNFGLYNADGSAKPAGTMVHNCMQILADPGNTAATAIGLTYSISGSWKAPPEGGYSLPPGGLVTQLVKANGNNYVIVWDEPEIVTSGTTHSTTATNNFTVTLDQVYPTVNIYDPSVGTSPIQSFTNNTSKVTFTLGVTDHPIILETVASAQTSPPPTPSANDTVVVYPSTTAIVDASGNLWTITSGNKVAFNGAVVSGSANANVTEIAYVNGVVWFLTSGDNWYSLGTSGSPATASIASGPTTTSPLPSSTLPPRTFGSGVSMATQRTQSYLLGSEFQDGQTAGSITPSYIRDAIVSMPMPNIIQAPFRPNFPPYNAKFDGTTDDTTAWTAMFVDIATRGYGEVIMPSGFSAVQPGQLVMPNNVYIHGQGAKASGIQRVNTTGGVLLNASGGTSNTAPGGSVILQDFQINGNTLQSGPLVTQFYGSGNYMERVLFTNCNDAGLQLVQVTDSVYHDLTFTSCGMNTSATGFTTGPYGTGTTVGSECLQILSATAASGWGYSTGSCADLRFVNCQFNTFAVGGIAIVSTTYNAAGAYGIEFLGTKMDAGNSTQAFTGLNYISMSDATLSARFEDTLLYFDGTASGTNVGNMSFFYATANNSILIRHTSITDASASAIFGQYVKCWGNYGLIVDGLFVTNTTAPTNGALYVAGGNRPEWNNINLGAGNQVGPTWYPPRIPSQNVPNRGLNVIGGAATPGTALSVAPGIINVVNSIASGAYVQLPAGATAPQSYDCTIINDSGSTINVMPPTGGTVAGGATNAATTMATNTRRSFNSVSATAWY